MNRLIAALKRETVALLTRARETDLEAGQPLHAAGEPVETCYFPCDAVVSQSVPHDGGPAVETGTVGREGVTAVMALIGDGVSFEHAVVQVPGRAVALPAAPLRDLLGRSAELRGLIGAYAQAYAAQVSQSVACNAVHPNEARMARWLLMCLDRTRDDAPLPLGTRFLGEMLGIGRPAVTVVAGTLQTAGLIRVGPDGITVLDRAGLEEAACDCYGRVRRAFERLLPGSYDAPLP